MSDSSPAHVEVQVTCEDRAEADRIAAALVDRRLAACVQQVPIRSTFRWEGRVEHEDEILLLVKTTGRRVPEVRDAVLELHSYDVPAVTAVEIVDGSPDFLTWIDTETT